MTSKLGSSAAETPCKECGLQLRGRGAHRFLNRSAFNLIELLVANLIKYADFTNPANAWQNYNNDHQPHQET